MESRTPLALGIPVLALGSCFAQRVGSRLEQSLFPITVNPFGTTYNPLTMARQLQADEDDPEWVLHDGLWRSLAHHSDMAARSLRLARSRLDRARLDMRLALDQSKLLILTFGSALAYKHRESGKVVASCHRLQQSLFQPRRIGPDEAAEALKPPLLSYLDSDPERRVVLTVSPVRYLRQGLVENSRSKASLLLACDSLCQHLPRTEYFPSYEILMDELRDYRFYEDDLAQPSKLAVDIIWDRFSAIYFDEANRSTLALLRRIQELLSHRLTPNSDPRRLAERGLELLTRLHAEAPTLNTEELSRQFERWKQL